MTDAHPDLESPDEAIPRLVREYGDHVHRFGLRLCDEPGFAEDLVQETFLGAYRSWAAFEGRSSALTWLYAIASRVCLRMQRRRAGQPRRVEPLSALLDPPEALHSGDPAESPLEYTIRRDEVDRLRRAISHLPAAFRLPLVLKELEGLTVVEVASILGLKEATVKTRLHRGRLTLRHELAREMPLPSGAGGEHSRRQCVDLLAAKLEAMAHDVPFPVENERICQSCHATLSALDRIREVSAALSTEPLPPELKESVLGVIRELEGSAA